LPLILRVSLLSRLTLPSLALTLVLALSARLWRWFW
jgi:hypothetical protein